MRSMLKGCLSKGTKRKWHLSLFINGLHPVVNTTGIKVCGQFLLLLVVLFSLKINRTYIEEFCGSLPSITDIWLDDLCLGLKMANNTMMPFPLKIPLSSAFFICKANFHNNIWIIHILITGPNHRRFKSQVEHLLLFSTVDNDSTQRYRSYSPLLFTRRFYM